MGILYIVRPTQLVVVFLHLIGLIVASAGVAGVSVGILTALLDMDTPTGLLYVLSWCGSLVLMGLTVGGGGPHGSSWCEHPDSAVAAVDGDSDPSARVFARIVGKLDLPVDSTAVPGKRNSLTALR